MKLTKSKLKQIIREELISVLSEKLDADEKKKLKKLKGKDQQTPDDEEKIKDLEHK